MDYYLLTDKQIAAEIGGRYRLLGLNRNLTQKQLAVATALSLNSIQALESGKTKLSALIVVLRELGALDGMRTIKAPSR
jgi:transcriptional regulator with XRE-family HTH domain